MKTLILLTAIFFGSLASANCVTDKAMARETAYSKAESLISGAGYYYGDYSFRYMSCKKAPSGKNMNCFTLVAVDRNLRRNNTCKFRVTLNRDCVAIQNSFYSRCGHLR